MDLKIIEKPLFFLVFFQYFKESLGSLPNAGSDQEKPTQGRAKPEKTNQKDLSKAMPDQEKPTQGRAKPEKTKPKSLPKAVPDQERSTQDRVRPGKACPRQGQARKGLPKAGSGQIWPPNMAMQAGSVRDLLSKLSY